MGQCALVSKLAIALDEPLADLLWPAFIDRSVRKWTRVSCRARACFVELAWYMR